MPAQTWTCPLSVFLLPKASQSRVKPSDLAHVIQNLNTNDDAFIPMPLQVIESKLPPLQERTAVNTFTSAFLLDGEVFLNAGQCLEKLVLSYS